ncbi:MAG TPA: DUF2017 family protein [Dermatophilaceae bacterium]|nr:DUF2017 family protein [Dermatophilaceae bacterium]
MAKAFSRKGARVVGRLDEAEREVVVGLLEQTRVFLAPAEVADTGDPFEDLVGSFGVADADQAPRDPALDRLLPAGHRGDAEVAAEFRRFTEQGLREKKSANIDLAVSSLREVASDRVSLDRDQAAALLVALTDVRLLLGERLGLRTDEDADALAELLHTSLSDEGDPDPRQHLLRLAAYYDFLTWLQESLAHALSR